MGGKAIGCGFSPWSVALYQAAVVADVAAEEEMAVSESTVRHECNTSSLHAFPLGFPLCIGVFWCIVIDAAVMSDKSQTTMDFLECQQSETQA